MGSVMGADAAVPERVSGRTGSGRGDSPPAYFAVHDQDDELTTAAANMERDFAVDRQLRLGGNRERAQVGAHQCMALGIVTRHDAG